jgi:hypothetical protein
MANKIRQEKGGIPFREKLSDECDKKYIFSTL